MYISRVRLENIRGFSGPRNADLTLTRPDGSHAGWTVIAGRNGSGKTSLLQAIALAVGGPITTAALNQDFRKWITTGQQQAITEVQLHVARGVDDPWDKRENASVKRLTGRLTWMALTDQRSSKPGGLPSFGAATSPDVGLDGPWGANPFGWFCAAYGPFRRLVGGTSEAQRLMSSPGPVGRLASLFHEDASLAEGVQWLIEMHLRALEGDELHRRLKQSALQLLGDDLFPNDYQISDVTSDGLWSATKGIGSHCGK